MSLNPISFIYHSFFSFQSRYKTVTKIFNFLASLAASITVWLSWNANAINWSDSLRSFELHIRDATSNGRSSLFGMTIRSLTSSNSSCDSSVCRDRLCGRITVSKSGRSALSSPDGGWRWDFSSITRVSICQLSIYLPTTQQNNQ